MNAGDTGTGRTTLLQSGLEMRTRLVLEEQISRLDGRTRSRLNQARQAAVVAAARPSALAWLHAAFSRRTLMPATGAAAAAVLVAVFMLMGRHQLPTSVADNAASALDVLDLVTDDDAMNLMEDSDNNDGSFYEWAAAQGDTAQNADQGAGAAST